MHKPPPASAPQLPRSLPPELASDAVDLILDRADVLHVRLDRSDAKRLVASMSLEVFQPRDWVTFQRSATCKARVMLVLHGEANIATLQPDGSLGGITGTVSSGATIGMLDSFTTLSASNVAVVSQELIVASLAMDDLHDLMENQPRAAAKYMRLLLAELGLITRQLMRKNFALEQVARSITEHLRDDFEPTAQADLDD